MIVKDDRIFLNWREWVKISKTEAQRHTANGTRVLLAKLSNNGFVECYMITDSAEAINGDQFNAYFVKTGRKMKLTDAQF